MITDDGRRMISEIVPSALAGERLDRIVSFVADISRSNAAATIAAAGVRVDGVAAVSGKVRLVEGQLIEVDESTIPRVPLPVADPSVEFAVVHEDATVIVVDKPAALVVHPGAGNMEGTLVHGLLARIPTSQASANRPGRGSSTASTPAAPGCSWSHARRRRRTRSSPSSRRTPRAVVTWRSCGVTRTPRTASSTLRSDATDATRSAWPWSPTAGPARTEYWLVERFSAPAELVATRVPSRNRPHPPDPRPPGVDRSPARRRRDVRPAASVARSPASVPPRRRAGLRPPGDG